MKLISLFSGCGGFDLGFKYAGYRIIWANEFDSAIWSTYQKNHPEIFLEKRDIRLLESHDIPDCDGIIGGPPCQSWSEGGKGLGLADERGQLFFDYIRIVKEKRPLFFIIENVKGLTSIKHQESYNLFLLQLECLGYNINAKLLNASGYRIPQDRERVFIVGIRRDKSLRFSFPVPFEIKVNLFQAIGDILEEPQPYIDNQIDNSDFSIVENNHYYNGSYDQKYMSRNRVRSWDEQSFTIQALAKNIPIHPRAPKMRFISQNERIFDLNNIELYRRLSVRECARIQSFPDKFKFIYSDIKVGYKMIGNAVPPRLSYAIAKSIIF